jgi:hypothetical protein
VRASLRLVWRVITPTGDSDTADVLGERRLTTGTARTRVGVSSYQVGVPVSMILVVSNASVTWLTHSGFTAWPTKSR